MIPGWQPTSQYLPDQGIYPRGDNANNHVNEINVTITKVGNNVITSKIDSKKATTSLCNKLNLVSKQQVATPDAMMLDSEIPPEDL